MTTPGEPAIDLVAIRDPGARPHPHADWRQRLELLRAELARCARVVVAYSGGVDSSVVLAVAHEQLGARALGVIGVSDSYAAHELELALAQAARIGARVETVTTGELADPVFAGNPFDRCYHCKRELYARLAEVAAREEAAALGAAPGALAGAAPPPPTPAGLDGRWRAWTAPSPTISPTGARAAGRRPSTPCARRSRSWASARPTCAPRRPRWAWRARPSPRRRAWRRASPTGRRSRASGWSR